MHETTIANRTSARQAHRIAGRAPQISDAAHSPPAKVDTQVVRLVSGPDLREAQAFVET